MTTPDDPARLTAALRVAPGAEVRLARDFDPRFAAGLRKRDGVAQQVAQAKLLGEYQARLAAQATDGVLIVLQGIDAAGKDGTIRHVMGALNPQGVKVSSFKQPSAEELRHDFLWRYQAQLPGRGEIAIFNRSHYEEVLVVRVHPESLEREGRWSRAQLGGVWARRYREINDWERHLADSGIRVVKVFLNLSKGEQRRRFLRRLDTPERNWKFSAEDVGERAYWDEYEEAFSAMLSSTSRTWAPWYVVPADRKWFARLAISSILLEALMRIDPRYPVVSDAARAAMAQARRDLLAEPD